jgi:hypothetical protein
MKEPDRELRIPGHAGAGSPLCYALSKNISTKGPLNCRSLGFARDDKGEGGGHIKSGCRAEAFFITLGEL